VLTILLLLVAAPVTEARTAAPADTTRVSVYFTPRRSECDVVNRRRRTVRRSDRVAGAVRKLLAGPTAAERRAGVTSYLFSRRTAGMLRSVAVRDGVAHVDLRDLRGVLPKARTSCGRTSLLSQLNTTVMQFLSLHSARYSINGSERTFYRWLRLPVPPRSRVTAVRGSLRNTRAIHRAPGAETTLTRIRVGRHPGFDRVVFQFSGGLPTYWVSYTSVPRSGGSGAPIPFGGTTALQIDLAAHSVVLDVEGRPRTFRPLRQLTPRFPTLRTVRYGGEFEGQAAFGAGLRARTGFRVIELANPTRLAIDVTYGAKVRTLHRGQAGPDVRDWQRQLNTVQFGTFATSAAPGQGRLVADGAFGARTVRATRVFQRSEGVDLTGVVGWATRGAMRSALWRTQAVSP
jgi:hypothetical protein